MISYFIIFVLLLAAELVYFKVADKFNIIDKPNERSSHSNIVLRGGGIIFIVALWVWYLWLMVQGEWLMVESHWPLLAGVTLAVQCMMERRLLTRRSLWRLPASASVQGKNSMAFRYPKVHGTR